MRTIQLTTPVGELVRRQPAWAEVLEALRIDYCCGGEQTLGRVCAQRGFDPAVVVELLLAAAEEAGQQTGDTVASSFSGLCREIEREHHAYLARMLPKIRGLAREVTRAHAEEDPRLYRLEEVLEILEKELNAHISTAKEVFFPFLCGLEDAMHQTSHTGEELRRAILALQHDHDGVGDALGLLRELTDGFGPPDGACEALTALYGALWELTNNVRQHVHKENNILFPRALEATG